MPKHRPEESMSSQFIHAMRCIWLDTMQRLRFAESLHARNRERDYHQVACLDTARANNDSVEGWLNTKARPSEEWGGEL